MNEVVDISWLLKLRWLAATGYLLGIILAASFLTTTLPLAMLCTLVGIIFISNGYLSFLKRNRPAFSSVAVGIILVVDTALLALLLYCTGGSSNPFSTLFLVHITLAAVLLGPYWTWLLTFFSSACFALLFTYYIPLDELSGHHMAGHGSGFSLHLKGMLLAFALTATLIAYFLVKISSQLQKYQTEKMDQTRLAALTTLAAGAAHELGSPLGAISIASGELNNALSRSTQNEDLLYNIQTIQTGVDRCKTILTRMNGQLTNANGLELDQILIPNLLEEIISTFTTSQQTQVAIQLDPHLTPIQSHSGMLKSAITEMIKNALDASNVEPITIAIFMKADTINILVSDNGSGMTASDLQRIREPFYTTKPTGQGMGLGFFLIDLFAKSMGGTVSVNSNKNVGTMVQLILPVSQTNQGYLRHA